MREKKSEMRNFRPPCSFELELFIRCFQVRKRDKYLKRILDFVNNYEFPAEMLSYIICKHVHDSYRNEDHPRAKESLGCLVKNGYLYGIPKTIYKFFNAPIWCEEIVKKWKSDDKLAAEFEPQVFFGCQTPFDCLMCELLWRDEMYCNYSDEEMESIIFHFYHL